MLLGEPHEKDLWLTKISLGVNEEKMLPIRLAVFRFKDEKISSYDVKRYPELAFSELTFSEIVLWIAFRIRR